jgi:beta-xylosidase
MKRLFLSGLMVCMVVSFVSAQKTVDPGYYINPVIPGDVADPTLLRIGDTYYAAGTSSEWAPFYPLYTSRDLVNWTQAGHIFDRQPEWTLSSFWAPELFYYRNKVYCYYTARRKPDAVSYIGVATADEPTGKYTDHGILVPFGKEAIDAFVFEDEGQLYITWKAYGLDNRPIELLASRLSADGLSLEGEPFTLLKDDERTGMEGQYIFKKGDYYYLLYSAHGCCGPKSNYDVYAARSKNFAGPYEKYEKNPVLHGGGDILSCGHGTAATTPDGRMFYLCHAYFTGNHFYAGRQPILQELVVGKDDWVHFTTGSTALSRQPLPFPRTRQQPLQDFEDTFDGDQLRKEWSWNYVYARPQITFHNGTLSLSGTTTDGKPGGTALCLRPASPHYSYETAVTNVNDAFKGLCFYGDDTHYVAWGCTGNKLVLCIANNDNQTTQEEALTDRNRPVYLRIEVSEGYLCAFNWSLDGRKWNLLNVTSTPDYNKLVRWDRVARPGLFHQGDADQPALFSHFKLTVNLEAGNTTP